MGRPRITTKIHHGLVDHPLYVVWDNIKSRCYNEKNTYFHNYGGRGIRVNKEWYYNFKIFYDWCIANGWKLGLQIDREDNDGNYEPSNCRFVTHHENSFNKRRRKSKLGYTGVKKSQDNFMARVSINNSELHVGSFPTIKEAVEARNKFIRANKLANKEQEYIE